MDDPDPEAPGGAEPEDPPAPRADPPGKPLAALTPLAVAVICVAVMLPLLLLVPCTMTVSPGWM
ncbi:MAG: alpha/beta fold hydrolase, partial [Solirubrobacteraceae bacterium]